VSEKRRKRYRSYDRHGELTKTVSIEERPGVVERGKSMGDWEVDAIIGRIINKQSCTYQSVFFG
jgi:IS30 family transposase